ncbi:MAG: TetR/AcrR family transcriptional regulator [Pseudomonadota bacterium]
MARPKASPEKRAEVRRSIQQAAADLYRAEGVSAITARAVARHAGVSVGTIYAYFGDLTALMQSLWVNRVQRQNDAFRQLASKYEDALERLHAMLAAYLRFGIENADLYKGTFLFVRPEKLDTPERMAFDTNAFPALLVETIQAGQARGQIIPGEPAQLAQMLWSGLHGCLAMPVNLDRLALMPADKIAEPMVDMLMRGISR